VIAAAGRCGGAGAGHRVANTWDWAAVISGEIRCRGVDWAAHIPSAGTVTVGLQVGNDRTTPTAPTLTIQN